MPKDVPEAELAQALEAETINGDEALLIRAGQPLTPYVLECLRGCLMAPIPGAFIVEEPPVKGKPYASTGISSVQVQIDRLNYVLGPTNWLDNAHFEDSGKVCRVTLMVLGLGGSPALPDGVITQRSSYGGVNQASTEGNRYKGSYTNAAKLAIARLGPGHEIYVGAADLDPDTNPEIAEIQGAEPDAPTPAVKTISDDQIGSLTEMGQHLDTDGKREFQAWLVSRRIGSLTELPGADFPAAFKWLEEKTADSEEA